MSKNLKSADVFTRLYLSCLQYGITWPVNLELANNSKVYKVTDGNIDES